MESIESSDLEEGEILEHDLNSLKDSLSNEKDGSQAEGYVNIHLKRKLDLYDKKNCSVTGNNYSNNMLDSISSSEEEFSAECNQSSFINENRHFNFYNTKTSRPREAQSRMMLNGSAEDIMCQIDQTICRKSHSYKHKKHKDIRYNWEKLYEKKNCSNRHRFQEMVSSHKISEKKKVLKSKGSSDGSESEQYFKSGLCKRKKYHKKRKSKGSDDYYCNGHNNDKKNYKIGVKKPANKIFRDFDEVRKALLEKLKQQEMEIKKNPKIVDDTTNNLVMQEVNILMDSSNYEAEPSKEFNKVLPNENNEKNSDEKTSKDICLEIENDEDLDLVQLRLIALASNRKQKNVVNLNESFQETKKTSTNKLECTNLFKVQTENNVGEVKEEEEEEDEDEDDSDLNRYELLLRAEALKTALLKKHQKRLIKLKTPKLNQLENNNESDIVSTNADKHYQKCIIEEVENNISQDLKLKLENDSLTSNFDKENDMEVIMDPINPGRDCEKNDNVDKSSQSSGENVKKKYQKTKFWKRKKKLSLCEDTTKDKYKNSQPLEEDCLTLRSQLLYDLIKKKTLKESEKKSILLDSVQISTNNNNANINSPAKKLEPIKKFIISSKASLKSMPKVPKPEMQRIIVHLGSEESSEDEEIQNGKQENSFSKTTEPNENINVGTAKNAIPEELRASYERSVELLLSEARKKIEIELGKSKNNEIATPEAVYKHLPPSQRLEYIKLKQKIAERERLKKFKKEVPNGSANIRKKVQNESTIVLETPKNTVEKSTAEDNKVISQQQNTNLKNSSMDTNSSTNVITSTTTVPSVAVMTSGHFNTFSNLKTANNKGIASPNKFMKTNKLVTKERNLVLGVKNNATYSNPSNFKELIKKNVFRNGSRTPFTNQSNSIRNSHNQILLSKLKLLLKKIKIEKTIEENYEKEISKLKNQLSLFEKKKSEQRFKIKKLAEESVKTYKIIQNGGSKKTSSVEVKERSQNKKVEATNPVKNDSVEKKVENDDKNEITEIENVEENSDKTVKDLSSEVLKMRGSETNELGQYNSPLEVFSKASNNLKRVDPNIEMCQFDLTGICRDEECTYQHLRSS